MRPARGFLLDSLAGCKPCSRFIVRSKASWERGRPARTRPGTASAFSRTWIDPTAPWLSFDPAVAVPADVVAACKVALMLSNPHKEQGCGRDARAPRPIAPPLSGSRRSRAVGRRLMRWGVNADPRLPKKKSTKGHGGLRRATKGSGATCNGLPCSRTLICHPCPNFDSCFTWIDRMDRMKNQAILSILPIHVSFNNCRHRLQRFSPAELRRRRRHFSPTRRRPNDSQANNPPGASPGVPVKPRRRRPHLAVGVSPWKTMPHKPSRVGGGSNPSWCSIANKPERARRSLYPEGSPKKSLDGRQMNSIC